MVTYQPNPIDTSQIALPKGILELTELLARNAHDIWAKERIEAGWKYGLTRDDLKKEHPDLIPYEDLPESEKLYDRQTVINTLMAIIALGYRLHKED
ncbi:MAG: Ryanodine receptor Ryr [Methanothrix sp.]|nr:MAG: Ryanodine receptor Ryr [Methanothrix sp.]